MNGFRYQPDFLRPGEEGALLREIAALPLEAAPYREYTAKRRILRFEPVPAFLAPLGDRVSAWAGMASPIAHALVTEYRPGTQLGWHRDSPEYAEVAGVSLGGRCRMRWRRYPHRKGDREAVELWLEPRSAYLMRDEARWGWQHSIPPAPELRYSITFRTLRKGAAQ